MGDLKKEERCAIATRPKDVCVLLILLSNSSRVLLLEAQWLQWHIDTFQMQCRNGTGHGLGRVYGWMICQKKNIAP